MKLLKHLFTFEPSMI